MAAVEITISGVMYDKVNRTMQNVVIFGEASLTGLGVGGGPIMPPPGGGERPPGYPAFPIAGWPGSGFPGTPGYPPTAEHPIVIPEPPPTEPPTGGADDNGWLKPPPEGGGWGYNEDYGWLYKPKEGQAGPKR